MIGLWHYLILSSILFSIGILGILRRKNLLMIFFSTEILLNAVNIGLVAIGNHYGNISGQIFAFFIIAVAASEVAVGLGLVVLWYKRTGSISIDSLQNMRG